MKLKRIINENTTPVSDIDYGTVNPVYADAVRVADRRKARMEKAFEDRKLEMPNEDRFAHKEVNATKELKKMQLAESLFTEWVDDKEQLTESFAQPNFAVSEDQYVLDDASGNIIVSKDIFSDYIKDGHVNILFVDEAEDGEDKVLEYKMIAEDDSNITMEYIGVATPGIDEEIADCQKYPIEKPEAKDSQFVSADDKQPKDVEEAKDSKYVSAGDKQPEKAAMKEEFTNWDSPESRIERYMTDLPELLDTMYDHYKRGNVEAQALAKALKVAYDTLDSVPQIDESLEASQKYPIEKPEAKDSTYVSAKDKQPENHLDVKDGGYVSAGEKDPNTANKEVVKESFLVESDQPVYMYKNRREPLADIIQVELTEGEWGYVKFPDGRTSPTRLPSANYLDDRVAADWDDSDKYAITVLGESADDLQRAINIAVKYNKEYRLEHISRPIRGKFPVRIWIYVDEEKDFDEPYKSPNGLIVTDKMETESLEDSQRYPIESPVGVAGLTEDVDSQFAELAVKDEASEALTEIRITTEGLANFKPYGEAAQITWSAIQDKNKMATFEFMLEDMYPNGVGSNQLNDLLAYDRDWIYDMLGMTEEEVETIEPVNAADDNFDW